MDTLAPWRTDANARIHRSVRWRLLGQAGDEEADRLSLSLKHVGTCSGDEEAESEARIHAPVRWRLSDQVGDEEPEAEARIHRPVRWRLLER